MSSFKYNVNPSKRVGMDWAFLVLAGVLFGISLGLRPREIPMSCPVIPWKTPSIPPLLLGLTQYVKTLNPNFLAFLHPAFFLPYDIW